MNNTYLKYIFRYFNRILPIISFLSIGFIGIAQPVLEWDKGYGGSGFEDCNAAIQTADKGYLLGGITSTEIASGDVTTNTNDDLSIPFWFFNVRGDYWALRTDENGDTLWTARYGGNKEDRMWDARETNDGGFILGGVSYSDSTGERTDTSRGHGDYWIVKTDALGNKEWDRAYGGDSTDILNVLIQTQDGGFMLGGWSISSGWSPADSTGEKSDTLRGGFDWWIVKTDALGDIEWEKSYGGDQREQLADIIQKEDGTYLIAGGTDSDVSGEVTMASRGERDFWMLHVDATGEILQEYRYGGNGFDDLNRIIISSDSTYVLAGSSLTLTPSGDKTDPGLGSFDWWILKIDTLGAIQWQHTFGGSGLENVYSLSQNSVNNYLLGGLSDSADGTLADNPQKGSFDYWIMYLTPEGDRIWDERYGGNLPESLEQLFQTSDGGYLMTGHSQTDVDQDKTDPSNGGNDFWIVKTLCNVNVELNDTLICPGDTVLISAYDANCDDCIYSWSDDSSIGDSIRLVNTIDPATYRVTLTDGVGCQRSDEINISIRSIPQIDLGTDVVLCPGDSYNIDAQNPGLDFEWNTTEANSTIDVFYPGTYAVTVTDAIGCKNTDSLALTFNELQAYVTTTNTSCGEANGTATVTATGGSGNYSYTWLFDGSNNSSVDNLSNGTYEVLVDDGNCTIRVKGVVSFSEAPTIEWSQNYGGSSVDFLTDIKQTPDDGYIVVGHTASIDGDLNSNAGSEDVWVKKLDANGNIEWQQTYGGSGGDQGKAILINPNGGYIIAARSSSTDGQVGVDVNHATDIWLFAIDDTGLFLWGQTYGGSNDEDNFSLVSTLDGGYLLANTSNSSDGAINNPIGGLDIWLIKTNANGVLEWENNYGGIADEFNLDVQQTIDGGYFVASSSNSAVVGNHGDSDFYIFKINNKGEQLWQYHYGGTDRDRVRDFIATPDGGFLITGYTNSNDVDVTAINTGSNIWLLKVNAAGLLEWQRTLGGALDDEGFSISSTGDGNYLLSGMSNSVDGGFNSKGAADYVLLKIDPLGNPIWTQNYGSSTFEIIELAFQTSDGGFILGGGSFGTDLDVPNNFGINDYWILKLNAPPLPEVSLLNDFSSCSGDSTTFSPIITNCSNCTWQWADGSNDSTRIETPTTTTNYALIITDEYGCTASDELLVTVNDLPILELGNNISLCAGEIAQLDAGTDGTLYNWSTTESTQTISVDTAATYAVTLTNAAGCFSEDSLVVTVNDLPLVDLGVDTAFCEGLSYTLNAGNIGADYQWSSTGTNSQTILVTTSDTYSVTVTDLNNCSSEDAVVVTVNPLPQPIDLEALPTGPFCPGSSLELTIQNSETGVRYELYDGAIITGSSAIGNGGVLNLSTPELFTTTTFNIVASYGGACSDTLSAATTANIGDIEAPIITCRQDTMITIDDSDCNPMLSISALSAASDNCGIETITYMLSGATTANSPNTGINDASAEVFNIGLTTVTYTAIDSFGNIAFCSFEVDVVDDTSPLSGSTATDMTVECDGLGNINAFNDWLANHAGATATDNCNTLTWTTNPANPVLSDDCGATGSVTVTFIASDEAGNSVFSTATFTIEDTEAPTFTVPVDITIGANEDYTDLTITGDVNDEADGCDNDVDDQGLRFATYTDAIEVSDCADIITRTWTLRDACGNTNTASQIITQEFSLPTASLSGGTTICPNETVDLQFNLSSAGTNFEVIYTDDVSNQTITLSNISDGHIIQVMPSETTTYSIVSVVDRTRPTCEGNIGAMTTVTVNQIPQVINLVETCDLLNTSYVVSFEITGGDAGTYTVSGDAGTLNGNIFTSSSIPKDASYTFFVNDENACGPLEISGAYDCACTTDAGNFQETAITVCGTETLTVNPVNTTLDGNDLIEFILHDGTANAIGNTIFYTSNIPEFSFQPGMQYGTTYFVTIIAGTDDGSGVIADVDACYSESTGIPIVFYESPTPVITAITDTELDCIETTLQLSAINSQTIGLASYQWSVSGSGNIVTGESLEQVTVDEVGNYILTILDNGTGCSASTEISISNNINPPTAIIAEADPLKCNTPTIQLDATGSSSNGNYTYQWTGGMIEADGQTLTPTVSLSADYTLVITDQNNGCTEAAQIFVGTDYEGPEVDAGISPQLDCVTTEVTLDGSFTAPTDDVSIAWSTTSGNIVSGANTLNPVVDAGGSYTLLVTNNENGCTSESTTIVTVDPSTPQDATITTIDPPCYGDENGQINILEVDGGTAPFTYALDGENFFAVDQFNNLAPGTYNFTIQDALGCEWDTIVDLAYPVELLAELVGPSEINLGDSTRIQLIVNQPLDTFIWNISDITTMTTFVRPTQQTTYQVTAVDTSGCQAEDFLTISVRKKRSVYIPTAFSPNDDGINDYFAIYADQSVTNIRNFRVFSRWGETLFAAENILPNNELLGWSGRFKNRRMQQGVYVYFVEIEFFDGRVEIFKGDVTLLR